MPNGLPHEAQVVEEAPFHFVSAKELTIDLPHLGPEGLTPCTREPDHRLSLTLNEGFRKLMMAIPRHPYGLGAADVLKRRLLDLDWLKQFTIMKGLSGSFIRARPDLPLQTITGKCDPRNRWGGAEFVHWSEDRTISIEEARRAVGVPCWEVLLGNPQQQWKSLGNGVDRRSATAIGVRLTEAWLASNEKFAGIGLI